MYFVDPTTGAQTQNDRMHTDTCLDTSKLNTELKTEERHVFVRPSTKRGIWHTTVHLKFSVMTYNSI